MIQTKRQRLESLRYQMESERTSFEDHWRELSDYILPRRSRWYTSDVNRGDRRNQSIIDSTPSLSSSELANAFMVGLTSPSLPWFRWTTPYPWLSEDYEVKGWLHESCNIARTQLLRSNIYTTLPTLYEDWVNFATSAAWVEENLETFLWSQSYPIGSYYLANDRLGRTGVFCRKFMKTVRQVVDEFARRDDNTVDRSVLSDTVLRSYDDGKLEQWIEVCHICGPNPEYKPGSALPKHKRFESVYYELGGVGVGVQQAGGETQATGGVDSEKYLRESGYDYFPLLCARWGVNGEDVYGSNCPGMISLGDNKQLQLMHKRKSEGISKQVRPPMMGPSSLRNAKVSILPGDITYVDQRGAGDGGLRPIYEVKPDLNALLEDIQRVQQRIERAYYRPFISSLLFNDPRQMTAREVEERAVEKNQIFGRELLRMENEVLSPLIEIVFDFLLRQDMLPPPPEVLQGTPLKIEYVSPMAQALKRIGLGDLERFGASVAGMAKVKPEVLDKVDMDQFVDEYAESMGIPPRIVVPDEKVAEMREARAKLQAQQMAAEAAPGMAKAAKDLAGADMEKDSMLKRLSEAAESGQLTESA